MNWIDTWWWLADDLYGPQGNTAQMDADITVIIYFSEVLNIWRLVRLVKDLERGDEQSWYLRFTNIFHGEPRSYYELPQYLGS